MIKPRLLSIEQAAIYLGRTPGAVRELIYKGRLPMVKLDRRIHLDLNDLDRIIEQHKVTEAVF
ncbi:MAG: helix-turn-helix domain-containing protein [Thermodesulfobacteriota bacterium]|nr:MAG: helix-turn-helix domain-containing protein [Thermodesulfobacteriota bacterium]